MKCYFRQSRGRISGILNKVVIFTEDITRILNFECRIMNNEVVDSDLSGAILVE